MTAEVLLPLSVEGLFSYRVPTDMECSVAEGVFVLVSFGKKRFYVGVIVRLKEDNPETIAKLKPITAVLPGHPVVSREELDFWQWMAEYYMVSEGTIMRLALPKTLLPESKTLIHVDADRLDEYDPQDQETGEALSLLSPYRNKPLPFDDVISLLGHGAGKRFEMLVEDGILLPKEAVSGLTPRLGEPQIALAEAYTGDKALQELLDSKSRQPARKALLERLLFLQSERNLSTDAPISKAELIGNAPRRNATLRLLLNEDVLTLSYAIPEAEQNLSQPEQSTLLPNEQPLQNDKPNLLLCSTIQEETDAITRQIHHTLANGHSVLLVVPPFSTIEGSDALFRLFPGLGNVPLVRFDGNANDLRRAKAIRTIKESASPLVIVGHRPAALAPLHNVGLMVLLEEQDPYYKQEDSFPRYHARDMLVWRALHARIPLLLTSVNPSLESLYNAQIGKFRLLSALPEATPRSVKAIDLKREREIRRLRWGKIISVPLKEAIRTHLAQGGKVLLVTSQKGFAPYLLCPECGASPKCRNCDVSLTYHKRLDRLVCRYCGYTTVVPHVCPDCAREGRGNVPLLQVGYGSERVETELTEQLPEARLVRIDAETTARLATRNALRSTIHNGDADIFIGTRMLTRLSALEGISLIVFSEWNKLTSIPDFRIDEELFSLCYMLSVRYPHAEFLFQTTDPDHPLIDALRNGERNSFLEQLLAERKFLNFAPFCRMIRIEMKGVDRSILEHYATELTGVLATLPCFIRVDGPLEPFVSRVKQRYIRHIVLKLHPQYASRAVRQSIRIAVDAVRQRLNVKNRISVGFDVDPY